LKTYKKRFEGRCLGPRQGRCEANNKAALRKYHKGKVKDETERGRKGRATETLEPGIASELMSNIMTRSGWSGQDLDVLTDGDHGVETDNSQDIQKTKTGEVKRKFG